MKVKELKGMLEFMDADGDVVISKGEDDYYDFEIEDANIGRMWLKIKGDIVE